MNRIELIFTGVFAFLAYSQASFSQEVCETLAECLTLQTKVEARIKVLSPPITRTTTTGVKFVEVRGRPELGEAWKDESGTIWGDLVLDSSSNKPREFGFYEAIAYCKSINARLPSEGDFGKLRDFLEDQRSWPPGYPIENTTLIPNLDGNTFWTSTGFSADYSNVFSGADFHFRLELRISKFYVRCISN